MIYPSPPFACFMGGEAFNDPIALASVIFGAGSIDDGNWPGDDLDLSATQPDPDDDSTDTVPRTHRFMADTDKPAAGGDYPVRQCAATGHWGAANAMVRVGGEWYLRQFAPALSLEKESHGIYG